MKKNPVKEMADYELVRLVKNVIMTELKNNNLLFITTPLNSGYGDYFTKISMSVLQTLTDDVIYSRGTEKKDYLKNRITYQYFLFDDLEIYSIIQEDVKSACTHTSYSFHGDQQKAKTYRDLISELVYSIVDETECDVFKVDK
jgi:hypothetical protein